MEPIARLGLLLAVLLLHGNAERLDQPAILHAGGARRFARAAIETQLQMPAHFRTQLQSTIGDSPHQVNATTWAIVFVAQLDIRRASGGTQPTMYTIEKSLVFDGGLKVGRRGLWRLLGRSRQCRF